MADLADLNEFEPELDEPLFSADMDNTWPSVNPNLAWFPDLTQTSVTDSHAIQPESHLLTPVSEGEMQSSYFDVVPPAASPPLSTELLPIEHNSTIVTTASFTDGSYENSMFTDGESFHLTMPQDTANSTDFLSPLPDLSWSPDLVDSPNEGLLMSDNIVPDLSHPSGLEAPQDALEASTFSQAPDFSLQSTGSALTQQTPLVPVSSNATASTTASPLDTATTWFVSPLTHQLSPEVLHSQSSFPATMLKGRTPYKSHLTIVDICPNAYL